MVQRLPNSVIKYGSAIILAIIPLLVANAILSPAETPNIDLTVLEFLDKEQDKSIIKILVQNTGNVPSTNNLILLNTLNSYKLVTHYSTDTIPKIIQNENNLHISIDRIAPQAYVILEAHGPILPSQKFFWVTTDKETEIVRLPKSEVEMGVSSVNISKDRDIAYTVVIIFGFAALIVYRSYHFYKSEQLRRIYLGIYNIPMTRFYSNFLRGAGIILIASIFVGVFLDDYQDPDVINNYTSYEAFMLDSTISLNNFLQIYYPGDAIVTPGILIIVITIFVAISISTRDIKIPNFIWSLPPSPDDILLQDIKSSFISSEPIAINTTRKLSEIDVEIFEITENNEIVGLISKKVAEEYKEGEKYNFKTIFNETKRSTKKNSLKIDRNNFIEIRDDQSLARLKEDMEKNHKIYAIIVNVRGIGIGVVSYEDLFGEYHLKV